MKDIKLPAILRKKKYIYLFTALAFICLSLILYSNTLESAFHYDDLFVIVNNNAIQSPTSIYTIWAASRSRFVTYLTYALNYHFHGLDIIAQFSQGCNREF